MQREEKLRLHLVNDAHQRLGLWQRAIEAERLILDGECPFDLVKGRGAEEVAGVVGHREGALEPTFVEAHSVSINRLDEVPGIAKFLAQRLIFA